jgi:hypothetical protein
MNRGLFKIILLLTIIIGCKTQSQQTKISPESRTSEIVLINADPKDRCEMGQIIESLSECDPRIIGINFIFSEQREIGCDFKFQQAIVNSGKVVLIEGFEDGKHVESHKQFRDYALRSGTTGLAQGEDDLTDSYYRVHDHRDRWEYSFPMHLALQYDTIRAPELAARSFPKDYPIEFYSSTQDFKTIQSKDILANRSLFKNKIAIIGYLGAGDENYFKTKQTEKSSSKTHGTVIIANIVLDILSDLDKKMNTSEPISKYTEYIMRHQKTTIKSPPVKLFQGERVYVSNEKPLNVRGPNTGDTVNIYMMTLIFKNKNYNAYLISEDIFNPDLVTTDQDGTQIDKLRLVGELGESKPDVEPIENAKIFNESKIILTDTIFSWTLDQTRQRIKNSEKVEVKVSQYKIDETGKIVKIKE